MEQYFNKIHKKLFIVFILLITLLPIIFCLCSCSPMSTEEVINSLFPNLWVFISHLFACTLLISLCVWVVWKPTKEMLQKRHDLIANEIKKAQKANEQATKELQEANQTKVEAIVKANSIVDQANLQAYQIKNAAEVKAVKIADKIKQDAKRDVFLEKETIKNQMHDQIVDIAFSAAEKIMKKEVSEKNIDDYLVKILKEINEDVVDND